MMELRAMAIELGLAGPSAQSKRSGYEKFGPRAGNVVLDMFRAGIWIVYGNQKNHACES